MILLEIIKELSKNGVRVTLEYVGDDKFRIDLNTQAKSDLYLYEDGKLEGRYGYTENIDLTQDMDSIITNLCYEFIHALHYRDYGNPEWFQLLDIKEIKTK